MKITIFYSWQSDLPNNTNRGFIENVINDAIKSIKRDEIYTLDLCIDRDTQGIPGSPNIASSIFDKISECDIFIADISFVTGSQDNGKRLSPNPNVLIELGYAISCLSWERIVLFFNGHSGDGEKLPFDIKLNRRIEYNLSQESNKVIERKKFASILKNRIIEITDSPYKNKSKQLPDFEISWAISQLIESSKNPNGLEKVLKQPINLTLIKASPVESLIVKVEKDIESIKQINGEIDPLWDSKVSKFIDDGKEFIDQVLTEKSGNNRLILNNAPILKSVTIKIFNNGTIPASDFRLKIKLPNWLLAFDEYPERKNISSPPAMPIPCPPPKKQSFDPYGSALKNLFGLIKQEDIRLVPPNLNMLKGLHRDHRCSVENGVISMWADKLLHKHGLVEIDDSFFLLALPNAEIGSHIIKAQYFCSEFDDWRETELYVEILES